MQRSRVAEKCVVQIRWQLVNHAAGNLHLSHPATVAPLARLDAEEAKAWVAWTSAGSEGA
jgi:hypothetical protein